MDESQASDLPGGELVLAGLRDLRAGRRTAEALLVTRARTRLGELGFDVTPMSAEKQDPELALYDLVELESVAGAHARYNALRQRLDRFLRAAVGWAGGK